MKSELTVKDPIAASNALDGWIDVFQHDDVYTKEEVDRVKRVRDRIDAVIKESENDKYPSDQRHLYLAKPPEDIQ